MGTLTASNLQWDTAGSQKKVIGTFAFGSSYNNSGSDNTTGETISAVNLGLSRISRLKLQPESGYDFQVLYSASGAEQVEPLSVRVKVFQGGSGTTGNESSHTHAVALDSGTSAAGSAHTHAFTGTASALNLASPVFSGTGLTAAGQVITTTDNQTMTLNQCAGMWLISATGATPPNLILSNTAVTGAPAVLTVQGSANTDAGAYKIVATLPVGTNANESSHTHGPGTLADAASGAGSAHNHSIGAVAGGEVSNGTDLSTALAIVQFEAYGY